ncbi:YveK family protein [Demequina litorisediminis]|uniref:CobQ/CobB/MinD/ParA nucleotide binding domain-containing protein n=1 Tax=Demequina litorisediminis TaxID=1849022 RepID=A0ABQ6IBW8_9MICO|nr:P-loop NTPase [Demequina litorisediminis]GMA35201.1 hypothetical protein GCM10025876_14050 [Demequina litorisediminis]
MALDDYTRLLRRYWWVLIVGAAVGAALGWGWAALQPKVYTAHAMAIVSTGALETLEDAQTGDDFARSRVQSYLSIAGSAEVAEAAIEAGELEISTTAAAARISVTSPEDTAVLRVAATGAAPEEAQALADAWVEGLSTVVTEIESDGSGDTVVTLHPVSEAQLPTAPTSPDTRMAIAVGLLAGLFVAVGVTLVRASLDKRLRTAADIKREFTVAVLGEVPFDRSLQRRGGAVGRSPLIVEAVRQVRTNIQFIDVDNPPRAMVVTSAQSGDGKSTTAIMLAEAIAAAGREVVLIDADLRRPSIATKPGAHRCRGPDGCAGGARRSCRCPPILRAVGSPLDPGGRPYPAQPLRIVGFRRDARVGPGLWRRRARAHRHPAAAAGDGRGGADRTHGRRGHRGPSRAHHRGSPRSGHGVHRRRGRPHAGRGARGGVEVGPLGSQG